MARDLPPVQGKTAIIFISLAFLGFAAYETLRLALADQYYRGNTLSSLTRAAALDPENSQIRVWLAEHQEAVGVDPTPSLEAASRLNRYDSAPLIRLALRAEIEGHRDRAAQLLLEAARIDKLYEPRWSLTNFYFRSGDNTKFWPAAREAFQIAYGDQTPLFRLCWQSAQDPAQILDAIPDRRSVLAGYLSFLLSNHHAEAAPPAARRLSQQAAAEDLQLLLGYLDQSLDLETWNKLCRRGLLPYTPLDPERGPILTNGDFRTAPLLHGFDWRVGNSVGVAAVRTTPSGLRITLSGDQPESCELLSQSCPTIAGRRYRFRFVYETSGIAPKTGLHWMIDGSPAPDLSSENSQTATIDFTATSSSAKLALMYTRVPGSTRIEGVIRLHDLSIEPE